MTSTTAHRAARFSQAAAQQAEYVAAGQDAEAAYAAKVTEAAAAARRPRSGLARFHAAKSPDRYGWEILDRENGDRRVEFHRSLDHYWPEREATVRTWSRILNHATTDRPEAIFELAHFTGQPTAVTRETVSEILDRDYPIAFPR
jgi:nucleoid-associated protein YgaU